MTGNEWDVFYREARSMGLAYKRRSDDGPDMVYHKLYPNLEAQHRRLMDWEQEGDNHDRG